MFNVQVTIHPLCKTHKIFNPWESLEETFYYTWSIFFENK
jgi:hypothetical protein